MMLLQAPHDQHSQSPSIPGSTPNNDDKEKSIVPLGTILVYHDSFEFNSYFIDIENFIDLILTLWIFWIIDSEISKILDVPSYRVSKPKFSFLKNIASKQCITSRECRARLELKQREKDLDALKLAKKNATLEKKKVALAKKKITVAKEKQVAPIKKVVWWIK
jgi:hypothetical protein